MPALIGAMVVFAGSVRITSSEDVFEHPHCVFVLPALPGRIERDLDLISVSSRFLFGMSSKFRSNPPVRKTTYCTTDRTTFETPTYPRDAEMIKIIWGDFDLKNNVFSVLMLFLGCRLFPATGRVVEYKNLFAPGPLVVRWADAG